MRAKEQILNDSLKAQSKRPEGPFSAEKNEQLTIEVLIDIRDQLNSLYTILCSVENISFQRH